MSDLTRRRLTAILLAPPVLVVLAVLRWAMPPLARLCGGWRRRTGRLRSVWAVTPILTLPLLARADRLLGFRSESMVYVTYYITRSFDRDLSGTHGWVANKAPALYRAYCEIVFLLALPRYDVFHYFYDRGLMAPDNRFGISQRELQYLKGAGRQLFTYAYGADVRARQPTLALGDWNFCRECDDPGRYCICNEEELSASMGPVSKVAKSMNAMGDMLSYVPRATQLHYWPIDIARVGASGAERKERLAGEPLVVAHAPNHGHFKGTKYVQAAVDQLRAEGCDIELRFIQGVPNTQVLSLFAQAHVVIDQLVGGFYGYTALEAMALGKPVISYVRTPDLALPGCPILNATPDTIAQVLREVYEGRHDLEELGRQGAAYVREKNSIEAVAVRLADVYLGKADLPQAVRAGIQRAREGLASNLVAGIASPVGATA